MLPAKEKVKTGKWPSEQARKELRLQEHLYKMDHGNKLIITGY